MHDDGDHVTGATARGRAFRDGVVEPVVRGAGTGSREEEGNSEDELFHAPSVSNRTHVYGDLQNMF